MTTDNEVVQGEQVSQEEQVSTPTESVEKPSLTEERVQELLKQAVEEGKQSGRKELQSQQDRNRAEMARVERRARIAEGTLGAARTRLQSTNPEAAQEFELAELKAERDARGQVDYQEQLRQQQMDFHDQFHNSLTQLITGMGVDTNDQRIDWAEDAPNYLEAQQRVMNSALVIQKENTQTMQSSLEQRLKDLEGKLSQVNIEVNSVSATTSSGTVAGTDADFVSKFASGELPYTKENKERYEKILDSS